MRAYRRIFKEILHFRLYFFGAMFSGVVWSLSEAQLAVYVKPLFESFKRDPKALGDVSASFHDEIVKTVIIITIFFLISLIAHYWHSFLNMYLGDCVSVELRRRMNSKFLRLDLSYQNKLGAGNSSLLSRLMNDTQQVEQGIAVFTDFLVQPLLIGYLLVWLFMVDFRLTSIVFIALPLVMFVMKTMSKSLRRYSGRSLGELETMTSVVKEGLDGVRVVQSFNLQSEIERRFDAVAAKYLAARRKLQSMSELAGPLVKIIAAVLIVALILYMASRIWKGEATIGDLMSYLVSIVMLQMPVKKMQDSYVKFQRAIASSERIFDVLDNGMEVTDVPNAIPFPHDWKQIEYRNVFFAYDETPVLKNFSLTINRGEVVAFVGESGSGKTTIVNLLERFFEPVEGQILIDGVPIKNIRIQELRKNIGLVTQDVFLFNDSIAYNIQSGDFSRDPEQVQVAAKSANAHPFISSRTGQYTTRVGDRGGMLSGGERQRVSIARAFLKDAPILILDEATSALDSASEIEVQKGLETLMQGRTTLVIAHRLSTVARANKIVVMKDGEVIETGTHQSLIEKQGEYFRFRQLQAT